MTTDTWASGTPLEQTYDLTMYDGGGGSIEDVALTRKEYIALKEHLAKIRGLACNLTEPDDDEPETGTTEEKKADREHVISFLRDKVRDCTLDIALMALEAIARNTGANTPGEDFLCSLIRDSVDGLTPEGVRDSLIQFEEEFAYVVKNCEYAHRFYPDLAAKAAEAGKKAR